MTDKEKEIRQIEQEHKEEFDAIYERIHADVERNIVEQARKRKQRQKLCHRIVSIAMAFVLVLTLAIVLPIVLRTDNDNNGSGYNSGDDGNDENINIRYSTADLKAITLDCNLKQYSELYNVEILYINWYDVAEEESCQTTKHVEKDNEENVVFLQETITNDETGYSVKYAIVKESITVDEFDYIEEILQQPNQTNIDNVIISYMIGKTRSVAKLEYKGYTYYFDFGDSLDEDEEALLEILSSMFDNNQQATA